MIAGVGEDAIPVEDEEDDNKPLLSSSEPELEAQSPHLLGNQILFTVFFTYFRYCKD
jgi:hypothetical protein